MTTPASHYHCVFMGPFVYTLHFTWKMVHYSTLMSGRPGHRDSEAGDRGLGELFLLSWQSADRRTEQKLNEKIGKKQ